MVDLNKSFSFLPNCTADCFHVAQNPALMPQSPVLEKACQTLVSITAFTDGQNVLAASPAIPRGQRDLASQPDHLFLWDCPTGMNHHMWTAAQQSRKLS